LDFAALVLGEAGNRKTVSNLLLSNGEEAKSCAFLVEGSMHHTLMHLLADTLSVFEFFIVSAKGGKVHA